MDKPKIRFSWDLHWACNYRCPYCWWHGKWDEFAPRNRYPGTDKVLAVWQRIYEKYGEAHIEIAGGEPTTYPDFSNVLAGLLRYHTVGMMTNFSGDIEAFIDRTPQPLLERLKIGATLHPLFADFDQFLAKAVAVRKKRMSLGVLYLAYPPQIKDIPRYRQIFADNDIYFSVSTFWGTFSGKDYPQAYTAEERNIIHGAIGEREGEKFQTTPLTTKGRLCNAGHTYGIIHPDGEVLRCGGGNWKGENVIMGNIFDEKFALMDKPSPCHSEHCPCNEWAFLLCEQENK